jgi:hypothetical protein
MTDRELWVQRLSPEHEARLAELRAPGGAAEQRAYQDTAIGRFRREAGITEHTDYEAAERLVAETQHRYRSVYGRELTAAELATTRRQAEMRSVVVEGARVPESSWQLAERHRWGVAKEPGRGSGMATRMNGAWTADSDPAVISATEQGEEAKRLQAEASYEAWRRDPVTQGIARPS